MMINPFSICVDGSNENRLKKMNPITVQIIINDVNEIES